MRTIGLVLTVVATVLLTAGNIGIWVDRNVADERRFVVAAREALDEVEVQRALARRIVNQMLAQLPLLRTFIGGQIERVVALLIGTPAFEGVLDYVAEQLHAVSVTGQHPTITVPARHADALAQIIATLVPGASGIVQARAGGLEIELFTRRDIPTYERHLRVTRQVGLISGVTGLVTLLVAAGTSGSRRRGLRRAGLAFAAAAGATVLFALAARPWLLGDVPDDAARTIFDHIYSAAIGGVLLQSALVFAVGVALWVAGQLARSDQPAITASATRT
jgi:hypothetical protein